MNKYTAMFLLSGAVALSACSQSEQQPVSQQDTAAPAATPTVAQAPAPATAAPAAVADPHKNLSPTTTAGAAAHAQALAQARANPVQLKYRGKVINVENAGGYSYIQADMQGQAVMLAATQANVKAGDNIGWGDFMVMKNFHSKALNRDFAQIFFVSQVVPVGAAPAPSKGVVASVSSGGGYTYIEVDKGGSSTWLAAPMTAVKTGDTVSWNGGSTMTNFTSSSMGKTFDEIVFVSGVAVGN